jgi:hypothetical protein
MARITIYLNGEPDVTVFFIKLPMPSLTIRTALVVFIRLTNIRAKNNSHSIQGYLIANPYFNNDDADHSVAEARGPFLTSPLGANFDPQV